MNAFLASACRAVLVCSGARVALTPPPALQACRSRSSAFNSHGKTPSHLGDANPHNCSLSQGRAEILHTHNLAGVLGKIIPASCARWLTRPLQPKQQCVHVNLSTPVDTRDHARKCNVYAHRLGSHPTPPTLSFTLPTSTTPTSHATPTYTGR